MTAEKDTATYICPHKGCHKRTQIKIIIGDWIIAEHRNPKGKWCEMGGAKL